MKKVILSAIIGALFGGAVVFAGSNADFSHQSSNIAQAKGLPETVQQTPVVENQPVENKQVDDDKINPNEVLTKNTKFYFNVNNNLITFNVIKSTISNLEFELAYENISNKSQKPVIIKGNAENSAWEFGGAEPLILPDEDESNHMVSVYQYKSQDCSFNISFDHSEIGHYSDENLDAIFIDDMSECKKLTDIGFNNAYIIVTKK